MSLVLSREFSFGLNFASAKENFFLLRCHRTHVVNIFCPGLSGVVVGNNTRKLSFEVLTAGVILWGTLLKVEFVILNKLFEGVAV